MERRLWDDGGYYLDNGATLCGVCHIKAETTELTVELIREKAGITTKMLPEHFYNDDLEYDKWGNQIQANGTRLRGELFDDESVQKILAQGGFLSLFTPYVKYPRTFHLPWSQGLGEKDKVQTIIPYTSNDEVVVTAKMDGENTTMYRDHIHARSLDSRHHESRSWVKQLHSTIKHDIPEGWRICGENLYAKHSIHYQNLSSYFMVFSIWNEKNQCLSWRDTIEYCILLDLEVVPVLYQAKYNEERVKECFRTNFLGDEFEGYVVRPAGQFNFRDFRRFVLKCVRANHVQTNQHWLNTKTIPNEIDITGRFRQSSGEFYTTCKSAVGCTDPVAGS